MRFICPEPPFVGHLIEWCVLKSGWSAFTLGISVCLYEYLVEMAPSPVEELALLDLER